MYDANAFDWPGIETGMFVLYAASTPANRLRARAIIGEEVVRARDGGFSPEELARAKTMCVATHAIGLQTPDQQARDFASSELLGLGIRDAATYAARINAVTNDQVRAAAQRYLDPNRMAVALVEPAK